MTQFNAIAIITKQRMIAAIILCFVKIRIAAFSVPLLDLLIPDQGRTQQVTIHIGRALDIAVVIGIAVSTSIAASAVSADINTLYTGAFPTLIAVLWFLHTEHRSVYTTGSREAQLTFGTGAEGDPVGSGNFGKLLGKFPLLLWGKGMDAKRAQVHGAIAVNEAHHSLMRMAFQLFRYLGKGTNVIGPGVPLVKEYRVIPPDGLICSDFLECRQYNFMLIRDIFFHIPPVRSNGVLEVILESIQLREAVHHRRGILGPEHDSVYAVGCK